MDAKTFFDNFGTIANAPGGVARLRELILDLAVSGKLSVRASSDSPVSTLLALIKSKHEPHGLMSEPRFLIPDHWEWVAIGTIAEHQLGKMLNKSRTNGVVRKYLRTANVASNGGFDLSLVKEMIIPQEELEKYSVRNGDLFVNEGGDVGKCAIWTSNEVDFAFQNHLHRLRPLGGIASRYLQLVLQQARNSGALLEMSAGVTIQNLSANTVRKLACPFAPLAEQKRIVAKVDELMALCDELEAAHQKRNSIRAAARKSAIDAISAATTPEELDAAWKRISDNWLTIADTPESISSLRSLIHDVALSGVFGGADTWREVQLGEISRITYGYTESAKQQEVGPKFLRITDIQNGMVDWDQVPYCLISTEDEKKQKLESGDIVFARTGATTGKSHLLVDPPRSVCASYLIRLRPSRDKILPEYLYLYFQSGRYWLSVKEGMSGTAQGGFNSTKLGNMSVLVPALDEQQRIIAKVSGLIALCDELDNSLLERNALALKIARAIVANVAA